MSLATAEAVFIDDSALECELCHLVSRFTARQTSVSYSDRRVVCLLGKHWPGNIDVLLMLDSYLLLRSPPQVGTWSVINVCMHVCTYIRIRQKFFLTTG